MKIINTTAFNSVSSASANLSNEGIMENGTTVDRSIAESENELPEVRLTRHRRHWYDQLKRLKAKDAA